MSRRSRCSRSSRLQELLLLLGREPHRRGDDVREQRRVVDVGHGHLELVGQVRHQVDDAAEDPLDVPAERVDLLAGLTSCSGSGSTWAMRYGDVAAVRPDPNAIGALRQDAQRPVRHLQHPLDDGDGADVVQQLGAGLGGLGVAGCDEHDQAVGAVDHVVDQADRALLADRQRRHRPGEDDRALERQHRKLARQPARQSRWPSRSRGSSRRSGRGRPRDAPRAGGRSAAGRARRSRWRTGIDRRRDADAPLERPPFDLGVLVDPPARPRRAAAARRARSARRRPARPRGCAGRGRRRRP